MVVSKLSKESPRNDDVQHTSPPARAGSTLTRVIAGFFGGTQDASPTAVKPKPENASISNASSSAETALQAALEQQTQTMQMMASLMKSSMEASPPQVDLVDLAENDKNAKIADLQDQVAMLKKQLEEKKDNATSKPKVQSKLPFKAVSSNT